MKTVNSGPTTANYNMVSYDAASRQILVTRIYRYTELQTIICNGSNYNPQLQLLYSGARVMSDVQLLGRQHIAAAELAA